MVSVEPSAATGGTDAKHDLGLHVTTMEEELIVHRKDKAEALKLCSWRVKLAIAIVIVFVAVSFVLLDVFAPTQQQICHRLDLLNMNTTGTADIPSCKASYTFHGEPTCPAQADNCKLLSSNSYIIQATEALVIGSLLLVLWWRETPRRSAVQYIADNSKSIILALCTHFLVVVMASVLGDVTEPKCDCAKGPMKGGAQPCDWYIVTFLMDVLTGVPITVLLYTGSARAFRRVTCLEPLSRIGDYEARADPSSGVRPESTNSQRVKRWVCQVVHWLSSALLARVVETALLLMLIQPLLRVANHLGWWACSQFQVTLKQWLNLMIFPIILDAGQFTVQNFILDGRNSSNQASDVRGGDANPTDAK